MNYTLLYVSIASLFSIHIHGAGIGLDPESIVVCLVRHGQTDWNKKHLMQGHTNIPLNNTGRKQLEHLSKSLNMIPFAAYYSSDLKRAIESAEILTQARPMPIITDARIRERNYGEWEGKHGLKYGLTPSKYKKNVESPESMRKRIFSFLDDIKKNHPGQYVLVVAHGGVIDSILRTIITHPLKMFRIPNGSLTCIIYQHGAWHLLPEQKLYSLCSQPKPFYLYPSCIPN